MPWTILGSAWLLAFAISTPMFCVPPIEHILKEELLLTHAQTSLLFSAPLLMMVAIAIPSGLIADRIGVRKAAGIGIIIIVVGAILRGTATSYSSLLAFTFIYGVGYGLSLPNLPKLVSAWVTKEKAGMATGIFMTGLMIGTAVPLAITMPLVFPVTNSFQGVFLIWSIPSVIAAILWWILVREPPRNSVYDKPVSRYKTPLPQILRDKSLWLLSIIYLLHNFFLYSWLSWAPALMMLKGATPEQAGLITSTTPWIAIPTVFLMPRLAYKLGLRKPFLWVPSIIIALLAWGAIYVNLSLSWLLMALMGVATSTRFTIILALPIEMRPDEEVGTASGLVLSVGYAGGIVGPLIGGRILDLTGSLDLFLLILTGISIATAVVAFMLPETGTRNRVKQP